MRTWFVQASSCAAGQVHHLAISSLQRRLTDVFYTAYIQYQQESEGVHGRLINGQTQLHAVAIAETGQPALAMQGAVAAQ